MIIYASTKIDEMTFKRLQAVAAAYKVELQPRRQKELFDIAPAGRSSHTALNYLDAITSIYKGLEKLKAFQTV